MLITDPLGRRTDVAYSGAAFGSPQPPIAQDFEYNDRNELAGSTRGTDTWAYDYDNIGNRTSSTVDSGTPLTTTYTTSELNQYRRLQSDLSELAPGLDYDADGNLVMEFDLIKADMNCDGKTDYGDIDPFVLALSGQAAYEAQYPYCDWLNGDIDNDNDVDYADLNLFVGQLGANGVRRVYTWDAENRLTSVAPGAGTEEVGDRKVDFAYDHMGRRVQKVVSTWNGSAWVEQSRRKFVWSGWLMLLELEETGAPSADVIVCEYTWGLDLAGQNGQVNSLEGAGGIGGLLAIHDADAAPGPAGGGGDYFIFCDANGNVGQLIDWSASVLDDDTPPQPLGTAWHANRLAAYYEYDPYGGVTTDSGPYGDENPMRFSTKYWDDETGLGYWGYRYYSPVLGRWLNRDPLGTAGQANVYAYAYNRAPSLVDPDGR